MLIDCTIEISRNELGIETTSEAKAVVDFSKICHAYEIEKGKTALINSIGEEIFTCVIDIEIAGRLIAASRVHTQIFRSKN